MSFKNSLEVILPIGDIRPYCIIQEEGYEKKGFVHHKSNLHP